MRETIRVPPALPSLSQSWTPWTPSLALKNNSPLRLKSCEGEEPVGPGLMSATRLTESRVRSSRVSSRSRELSRTRLAALRERREPNQERDMDALPSLLHELWWNARGRERSEELRDPGRSAGVRERTGDRARAQTSVLGGGVKINRLEKFKVK